MKYKIAYIDDSPIAGMIIKRMIEKQGEFELRHFSCPETFLKKAVFKEYDLILTDWVMPGMDGLELCKILKKDSSGLRIIICSAISDKNRISEALKFADAYLVKSINIKQFVSIFNKLISK